MDRFADFARETLRANFERDVNLVIISGMFGVGKTRLVQEVCRTVQQTHPFIRRGFIRDASTLPGVGTADKASERLALALLVAMWPDVNRNASYRLEDVIAKCKRDFGENAGVILHIDEYARNVEGVALIFRGSVHACLTHKFPVCIILSGTRPVVDLEPAKFGSPARLKRHVLLPLKADAPELIANIHKGLHVPLDVVFCHDVDMLIRLCGGYPASIIAMIETLNMHLTSEPGLRAHFERTGIITVDHVKIVFDKLIQALESRYSIDGWKTLMSSITLPDMAAGNLRRLPARTEDIMRRIMLVALADVEVSRSSNVLDKYDISYQAMEQTGLVTLVPLNSNTLDRCSVIVPSLALTFLSKIIPSVVEFDLLASPFNVGYAPQEQLAAGSLVAKLRALIETRGLGGTCTLEELRPGSFIKYDYEKGASNLVIELPSEVKVTRASPTKSSIGLTSGVSLGGPPLSTLDGTVFMAGEGEEAIDWGAVFTGRLNVGTAVEKILVFYDSQVKSLLVTTDVDGSVVQQAKLKEVLSDMEGVRDAWVQAWLSARAKAESKRVVVVHEVFTDRRAGDKFESAKVLVPAPRNKKSPVKTVAVVLTMRADMIKAIGPVLSLRSSLKRAAVADPLNKPAAKAAKASR